jgi:hypothetical protein
MEARLIRRDGRYVLVVGQGREVFRSVLPRGVTLDDAQEFAREVEKRRASRSAMILYILEWLQRDEDGRRIE